MTKQLLIISSLLAFTLLLTACGSAATPTPLPAPAPSNAPAAAAQSSAPKANSAGFATQSNEGGSVTVDVTPTALEVGKPMTFKIVMDTHSVDLSDDMTKIVILRDDAGQEYAPTAWDGAGPGGHHREGTLKSALLASKPKFVELVIKGMASVPERVFRWDLP